MAQPDSFLARWVRLMNRVQAWRSTLVRPATGFVSQPEPRTVGSVARGRQLLAGNFMFAGHLVQAQPDTQPDAQAGAQQGLWDITPPDEAFEEELQGFAWLDDLAAVGDTPARLAAQAWLWQWIARDGRGRGAGWSPDLAGRRLIRWIHHALFVLRAQDARESTLFYRSLAQQANFLARRWQAAAPGLPRFEALTGLIYAGLSLQGMGRHVAPACQALARECAQQIDSDGGIPTRNPEELLEVFTLLTWAATALHEAQLPIGQAHRSAIERIAPTLRSLRHADGGLARFHGGGRGPEGRLDQALAAAGVRGLHPEGLSMGFVRQTAGRTSLIIDAAPPPQGAASMGAHASTLAFELTSGRRPLVVNCGSGVTFGVEWRRAGRATASHSALAIEGFSSARLGRRGARGEWLVDRPTAVPIELGRTEQALRFEGGHNGYVRTHGLTHARQLQLSLDGRELQGEDMLLAIEEADKRRFDAMLENTKLQGLGFDIRFHLHPDVDASLDMAGQAISLALKSGEIWVLRHDGHAQMRLDPSVYLEKGRIQPRATKQVVLSARAIDYATRIRWSLAKAHETPMSIRDLHRDEMDLTTD